MLLLLLLRLLVFMLLLLLLLLLLILMLLLLLLLLLLAEPPRFRRPRTLWSFLTGFGPSTSSLEALTRPLFNRKKWSPPLRHVLQLSFAV